MVRALSPEKLVLETDRLLLRPLQPDDLDIAKAVLCSDKVMHYVTGQGEPEERVEGQMTDMVKRGAGGRIGLWCIILKGTGQKIGDAVLMPVPIEEDDYNWDLIVLEVYPPGQIEVGYLFNPEAWGRGYATEACSRVLQFAFEQTELMEVVATTDPDNTNSQNVLKKCGMRPIGKRRAYAWDDVDWFEITRGEWQSICIKQSPNDVIWL